MNLNIFLEINEMLEETKKGHLNIYRTNFAL